MSKRRVCASVYSFLSAQSATVRTQRVRAVWTAVAIVFVALIGCQNDPAAPQESRVLTSWVTESVGRQLTGSGRFIRPSSPGRHLSQSAADSVAVAVVRAMAPGRAFETAAGSLQRDRGTAIDFARLELCRRTTYIEVATDEFPAEIPGPARRAYGPTWGVPMCPIGSTAANVSVGVPDGPRDFRVAGNELVLDSFRQSGGGANWTATAVATTFPSGMTLTAEAAAEAVFVATKHRISEIPSAFSMIDDITAPSIPVPACAGWRVTVETPVHIRGLETGLERETRTFFVKRDRDCLMGPISLYVPTPVQPAGRRISFLRDTTGLTQDPENPFTTVLVPVNGLGHFELVTILR